MAPIECRPQGLVPLQCRAPALDKKTETVVEPGSELLYPESRGACCRQFKSKRDAVEPPADGAMAAAVCRSAKKCGSAA